MQTSSTGSGLMVTLHQINKINQSRQITMTRLATAQKINKASEAPAALIASENLRSHIATLEAESQSLQRTSHVVDTADAALGEISDQIIDARAANVALANSAGLSKGEREALQMQVNSAVQSVDRIARQSNFASTPTLDGNMTLHAGDDTLTIPKVDATQLGQVTDGSNTYRLADMDSNDVSGNHALGQSVLDDAFKDVLTHRATLGGFDRYAVQSRNNALQTELHNTVAAESEIRDTDYAREVSNLVRQNINHFAATKAMEIDLHMRQSMFSLVV